MNGEDFLKYVDEEVVKKASMIVGCSKCKFYLYVEQGSKWQKEEEEMFRKLVEERKLECPLCRSKMDVIVEIGK